MGAVLVPLLAALSSLDALDALAAAALAAALASMLFVAQTSGWVSCDSLPQSMLGPKWVPDSCSAHSVYPRGPFMHAGSGFGAGLIFLVL